MPMFGSTKQHNVRDFAQIEWTFDDVVQTLTRDRHQGDFVDQYALGNDTNYPQSHAHAGGMGVRLH